jgi:putative sterol carrier protein
MGGYFQLDESGAPPIFVLSHDRSGSSLLRNVLDTHSKLCAPGEMLFAKCMDALLFTVDNTLGVSVPELRGPDKAEARALEVRRVLNGIMQAHLRANGKSIFVEKWPGSSRFIDDYERVFPDAKYICLYRDPLDTIDSCIRTYGRLGFSGALSGSVSQRPRNLMLAMAFSWMEETRRLLGIEKRLPTRAIRVRYEDVVTDPEKSLPPLFASLGVEWEPEIITKTFEVKHENPGATGDESTTYKRKFDASQLGVGTARVPLSQLTEAIDRIDEFSAELGYPPLRGRPIFKLPTRRRTVAQEALDAFIGQIIRQQIPANIRAQATALEGKTGTVELSIRDNAPARWWITLDGGKATVSTEAAEANVTVYLDQTQFLEIAGGHTTLIEAERAGQIQVRGDHRFVGVMGYFF